MKETIRQILKVAPQLKTAMAKERWLSQQTANDVVARAGAVLESNCTDHEKLLELSDTFLPALLYTARNRSADQQHKSYNHLKHLYGQLKTLLHEAGNPGTDHQRTVGNDTDNLAASKGQEMDRPDDIDNKEDEDDVDDENDQVFVQETSILEKDEMISGSTSPSKKIPADYEKNEEKESRASSPHRAKRNKKAWVLEDIEIQDIDGQNERFHLDPNPLDAIRPDGSTSDSSTSSFGSEVIFGQGGPRNLRIPSTEIE